MDWTKRVIWNSWFILQSIRFSTLAERETTHRKILLEKRHYSTFSLQFSPHFIIEIFYQLLK